MWRPARGGRPAASAGSGTGRPGAGSCGSTAEDRCGVLENGRELGKRVATHAVDGAQGALAQERGGGVTKEDEASVRAVAAAFAERLGATRDFAPVARELYAEDFMARQLRLSTRLADAAPPAGDFMLESIPSLTFHRSLASHAGLADWTRLRVAADNLMHYIFLSLMSRQSAADMEDPEKFDESAITDVFPPEAVKVLDANPAGANFIMKKGREVVVKTPEELRALASTLEEAARLTRERLAETLAQGRHLESNLRLLKEASARDEVTASALDAEDLGYPKGARLFNVFAPNGYVLVVVKSGGTFKVVSAGLPHD